MAYRETEIDIQKKNADFRIIDVSGKGKNYATIYWKDGKRQDCSKKELDRLSKEFKGMCDF